MTRQEAYEDGKDRGFGVASWIDLPELGTIVKPFTVPNFIGTIENINDAGEVFTDIASEAESNGRQYSDFSFTAKELNDEDDDFGTLWDEYDRGIVEGINKNWESRKEYYKDSGKLELSQDQYGNYILTRIGYTPDQQVMFQSDYDRPVIAGLFGWIPCPFCRSTDGTIDCKHRSTSSMIQSATNYLDKMDGNITEDPGYF